VRREKDPADGRIVRLRATAKGESRLHEGRTRRVRRLAEPLSDLAPPARATLQEAAEILARVIARLA
jgi:DNA-binding MarR family transcriptional regulator